MLNVASMMLAWARMDAWEEDMWELRCLNHGRRISAHGSGKLARWHLPMCHRLLQAVAGRAGQQCVTNADVSPWGQPALLYGVPQGLLTVNNKTYSDVNLCCGGLMTFTFTARSPSSPLSLAYLISSERISKTTVGVRRLLRLADQLAC